MYTLQVTQSGSAIQVVPRDAIVQHPTNYQSVTFQNNGAAVMRVGDKSVSTTKGYSLAAGASVTFTCPQGYSETLNDFWTIGTATQVLDVIVIP